MDVIGIKSFQDITSLQSIKKVFLWCDKIGVIDWLDDFTPQNSLEEELLLTLTWLESQEAIFRPDANDLIQEIISQEPDNDSHISNLQQTKKLLSVMGFDLKEKIAHYQGMAILLSGDEDAIKEWKIKEQKSRQFRVRGISQKLRYAYNANVIPFLSTDFEPFSERQEESNVLQIIFKNLPMPDESVPLEEILEFKNNFRKKFVDINIWLNDEMISCGYDLPKIELKLEKLINDYKEYMQLQKMKVNSGAFESFVTIAANAPKNFLLINWGEIAKVGFILKHRRIALMEAEMNAPGRQIAYLIKTQEQFG